MNLQTSRIAGNLRVCGWNSDTRVKIIAKEKADNIKEKRPRRKLFHWCECAKKKEEISRAKKFEKLLKIKCVCACVSG